ncbi:hypothetical protein BT96DRAFT_593949 [Gymnopus androsaceus JB14]|uniref:GATA-type domain-containing protein n=1 Tax=Gymnopus androsaceus JB14 TaxID=1447944 RepID=A0A6A4HXU7_9AGAR|nr:hypothetical protein BT96DRAFT_593949 [Gymnopus androsaceus JB14]
MPSILNLKFKGNKSFVAFSNLSDVDSLTSTWKVCTKVASYLEQGQRLENLSWRLWHLQNLMVDTDNARSKREFKKLSKNMSDKLDKEKGRSIEELEAPDFKRNHSTDIIRQRAVEKERSREASQNARPGTIKRMQFTFSVDQPSPVSAQLVKKPDLKPSPEFNKRTRGAAAKADEQMSALDDNDKEQCVAERPRREDFSLRFPPLFSSDFGPAALLYPAPTLTTHMNYGEGLNAPNNNDSDGFSIPRPTIELPLDELLNGVDSPRPWSPAFFTSSSHNNNNDDKSPASTAPLYSTTALATNNNNNNNNDSPVFYLPNTNNNHNEDVVMQSVPITTVSGNSFGPFGSFDTSDADDSSADVESDEESSDSVDLMSTTTLSSVPPIQEPPKQAKPVASPKLKGVKASSSFARSTTPRPSLTVRTTNNSASTRIPSATVTAINTPSVKANGRGGAALNTNNVPGGQKAECSNCGATHTPLWRRGLNDELNCNACGLYCKLHKRPRPKTMRNAHGEGRAQSSTPRNESVEVMAQCYNCHTTATPLWRKDDEGKTVCNACGLYYKLHGSARPISMKSDVIRKRSRHDARRATNGGVAETPCASPGVSRRTSPSRESSPTLAPDSSTAAPSASQQVYDYSSSTDEMDYTLSKSELMNALGSSESGNGNNKVNGANNAGGSSSGSSSGNSHVEMGNNGNNNNNANMYNVFNFQFPGPYHPDHLMQYSYTPLDALPFPTGDYEPDLSLSPRTKKRRRMSSDSASEPPSSVVSFSSFADGGYSTTSPTTSHSQRSSISGLASEFPFSNAFNNNNNANNNNNNNGFNTFRGSATNAFWHPPMVQDNNHGNNDSSHSHSFLHPPMLPPTEDSPMDYLHPPMMHHDDDALFSSFLHPPMSLPSDDSSASSNGSGNSNSNGNQSNGNGSSSGMHGNNSNHYYVAQEYGLDMRIY